MSTTSSASPDVQRQLVGQLLLRWRERAGIAVEDAAPKIEVSPATLWRMEAGQGPRKAKLDKITALLRLYGAPDREVARAIGLAEAASTRPWWYAHRLHMPEWLRSVIAYTESSTQVRIYAPHRIPGLLQTPEYARAFGANDLGVELLEGCQAVLHRTDAERPHVWVVLDESILRRAHSPGVLHRQLGFLLHLAAKRRVTLQILPLSAPKQPAAEAFTIFRLAPTELPDVVCRHLLSGGEFTDDRDAVAVYREAWDVLTEPLSADDSRAMLETIYSQGGTS